MTYRIATTLLLSLLMIVGAYVQIEIPGNPLPIVLSNYFMMLAGLLLGSVWGLISVSLYLLLGALGVPVFADGTGGVHHFMDFKTGYLLGYVLAVFTVGKISERGEQGVIKDLIALTVGGVVLLGTGMIWLKISLNINWGTAFLSGVAPFLLGAFIKAGLAVIIAKYLRPILQAKFN